jgi:hypothetical protein
MAQINPTEKFTVVRQLDDPYDAGVYYVKAIIRDAVTDALLATLELEDKGNQRFTDIWEAVSDISGLGRWISIETTVYTDAGYTVKSERYGIDTREHLVQQRYNPSISGHGGGGADIDYKKISRLIEEGLTAKLGKLGDLKTDLQPILTAISSGNESLFRRLVAQMIENKPAGYDDKQIRNLLATISEQIISIDIPKPEPVDFTPLMNRLRDQGIIANKRQEELMATIKSFMAEQYSRFEPERLQKAVDNMYKYLQSINSVQTVQAPKLPDVEVETKPKKDRSVMFK